MDLAPIRMTLEVTKAVAIELMVGLERRAGGIPSSQSGTVNTGSFKQERVKE